MNLVDSSGWLEYFTGGKNAKYFANAIQDTKNLIVSTINIYEIYKKILSERDETSALQALGLMQQGKVVDVSLVVSVQAAKNSVELKMPMAESLIYTTAQIYEATLWTQDSDFENLDGVKFIRKSK